MLKPGFETDLAVAKACQFTIRAMADGSFRIAKPVRLADGEEACVLVDFAPSTDLNDAFLAAHKFGLWEKHLNGHSLRHPIVLWSSGGRGVIGFILSNNELSDEWVNEATPALAICAAILKLAEKTNAQ